MDTMKQELRDLAVSHSTETKRLKTILSDHCELNNSINVMEQELSLKKNEEQAKLSKMDKDQLKEFGSNESIRNAKIEGLLVSEKEAISSAKTALRTMSNEIELTKLDIRHLRFEKEVLEAILMS